EPLARDGVVDAPDAVLEQGEEALDGLGVRSPFDVDAVAMPDTPMDVLAAHAVVAAPLVREQNRGGHYEGGDGIGQRRASTVGDDPRPNSPLSLHGREHD